jgi:hypothetical protein
MMRFTLAASVAAIALGAAPAAAQDMVTLTPAQIGQIFCLSRVGNDMAPVSGLLTAGLRDAIVEAEAKNTAYEAANPGDKPPLGDGIPWQTAPDYAATCTPGDVTFKMDEADVKIAYGFPDYPDANFTDTLQLRLVDDPVTDARLWRIDNVGYAEDGDLRTMLASIFMDN